MTGEGLPKAHYLEQDYYQNDHHDKADDTAYSTPHAFTSRSASTSPRSIPAPGFAKQIS
jgi:hypothetical protein